MNIQGAATPGSAYMDRSPISPAAGFDGAVQNDAGTTRVSYTVPAGRRAILSAASLHGQTIGAPTAGEFLRVTLTVTPSGGSGRGLARIVVQGGTLNSTTAAAAALNLYLFEGDAVTITSVTNGALAQYLLSAGLALLEFAA